MEPRRRQRGFRFGLSLLAALAFLFGCGAGLGVGGVSLTGGSVPIGTSRVKGIVLLAENVSQGVSNATVLLAYVPTTKASGTRAAEDKTEERDQLNKKKKDDEDSGGSQGTTPESGEFDSGPIIGGTYVLTISTPFGVDLGKDWAWRFTLPDNSTAWMVAALWPRWFDPTVVDHVALTPDTVTLKVGESARFAGTAYDKNNTAIPLSVSYLLTGDIGVLSADGTFRATRPGSARLTAWMHGAVASAQINVLP